MAKEKPFDYKQASEGDLQHRLGKSQEQLFKLRFRAVSAPVKNTMEIRHIRREIARIKTILGQKSAAK